MSAKRKKKRAPAKRRTTLVEGRAAVRALTSPLRMDIIQTFATKTELTVGDLAQKLGMPRGSLYYHVRKLVDIGVLVETERRLVGRRYESVYTVAGDRIAVGADPTTSAGRSAAAKLVWSSIRQAGREFETALNAGLLEESGAPQIGLRQRVWLTDGDLTKVNALLERLEDVCTRASAREKGRLYSITTLIVPLADDRDS